MNNNSENENYRFIVFVESHEVGYYSSMYDSKPHNRIDDIVAIVKSEDTAKDMCKDRKELGYTRVKWED